MFGNLRAAKLMQFPRTIKPSQLFLKNGTRAESSGGKGGDTRIPEAKEEKKKVEVEVEVEEEEEEDVAETGYLEIQDGSLRPQEDTSAHLESEMTIVERYSDSILRIKRRSQVNKKNAKRYKKHRGGQGTIDLSEYPNLMFPGDRQSKSKKSFDKKGQVDTRREGIVR